MSPSVLPPLFTKGDLVLVDKQNKGCKQDVRGEKGSSWFTITYAIEKLLEKKGFKSVAMLFLFCMRHLLVQVSFAAHGHHLSLQI